MNNIMPVGKGLPTYACSEMELSTTNENQEFTVKLLNQSQLPVYQEKMKANTFTIDVDSFPVGIYSLQVLKGNRIYSDASLATGATQGLQTPHVAIRWQQG